MPHGVPHGVPRVAVRRLPVAVGCDARPAARSACSLVALDATLFLFGGSGRFAEFYDDLWSLELEGGEVRYLEVAAGPGPRGRWGHIAVSHLGKMWLWGGTCPGEAFHDLWCNYLNHKASPCFCPFVRAPFTHSS